ncbi:hypothetical protein QFZ81_005752 [Paenibacillus sp. V4I9]|uniref:hypothetical protein n=1 Tax=Paenibacillus sp. V4I9 TaxID=3042308 RepID=UPI00278131A3|nr:hypothetical protein [Paenibacillus sp. V4I9]
MNKIYKIELKTNETKKIVNTEVSRFRILGEKLYYIKDMDNDLYSSALDGTGERKLSENAVSWFDGIDDSDSLGLFFSPMAIAVFNFRHSLLLIFWSLKVLNSKIREESTFPV